MSSELKVVLFILAFIFTLLGVTFCLESNFEFVCTKSDEVIEVGGCDRNGYCGAMTRLNGKESLYRPVVGERVCLKSERRKRVKP